MGCISYEDCLYYNDFLSMLWYIANATIKYQRRLKEKAGNIKMNDNP
jgi:hypothetical protein